MNEVIGDLWSVGSDWDAFCCTTNLVLKANDELVMGAGIAKQFNQKYPGLAKEWSKRTKEIKRKLKKAECPQI